MGIKYLADRFSGGLMDYYKPLELLKKCTPGHRRKVSISHGYFDEVVPIKEADRAINILGGMPDCYEMTVFTPPQDCDGVRHGAIMLQYPDHMRKKLCRFWGYVFEEYNNSCGLD